jgi:hypothetical protein
MRSLPILLVPAVFVVVAACTQQAPMVYVLESRQSVTLVTSASVLKVRKGETVVLHVERRTAGKWKQIRRDDVLRGQCWVYRPPPESEAEVADNVEWEIVPEDAVRFNEEYRLDHTRIATMQVDGTIRLTPLSAVTCEADRVVSGPSIEIEVTA